MLKIYQALVMGLFLSSTTFAACPLGYPTIYSQGNSNFNDYANWNSAADGSGATMTDLCGDTLVVQVGHSLTISTLTDLADKVLVVDGSLINDAGLQIGGNIAGGGTLAGSAWWDCDGQADQSIQMDQPQVIAKLRISSGNQVRTTTDIAISDSIDIPSGVLFVDGRQLSLNTGTQITFTNGTGMSLNSTGSMFVQQIAEGDTIILPLGPSDDAIRPMQVVGEFGTVADAYTFQVTNHIPDLFKPHQLQNDSAFVQVGWTITEENNGGGNLSFEFPWMDSDAGSHVLNNIANLKSVHKDASNNLQLWEDVPNQTPANSGSDHTMQWLNETSPFGIYITGVETPQSIGPPELTQISQQATIAGGNVQIGVKTINTDFVTTPPTSLYLAASDGTNIGLDITVHDADSISGTAMLPCDISTDDYSVGLGIAGYDDLIEQEAVQLQNNLSVTIQGPDTVCADADPAVLMALPTGGTAPYTFSWDLPGTPTDPTVTTNAGGTITLLLEDANGCDASAWHVVQEFSSTDNALTGLITFDGNAINQGEMELFQIQNGIWDMLNSTTINSDGTYDFDGLTDGDFIILARPDSAIYPGSTPTYFTQTNYWDSAKVVSINCQTQFTADLELINLPVIEKGDGIIRGTILDNVTAKVLGDPIPGLDVVLVKIPPNAIVAHTTTDEDGFYQFEDLPNGDYEVQVQLPGAEQLSTWEVTLSDEAPIAEEIDYLVDTTGTITKTSFTDIGLYSVTGVIHGLYPNPATGQFYLEWDQQPAAYQIEDLSGRVVQKGALQNGLNTIHIGDVQAGMYIVRASGKVSVLKVK